MLCRKIARHFGRVGIKQRRRNGLGDVDTVVVVPSLGKVCLLLFAIYSTSPYPPCILISLSYVEGICSEHRFLKLAKEPEIISIF
jgi:hypothetical protein